MVFFIAIISDLRIVFFWQFQSLFCIWMRLEFFWCVIWTTWRIILGSKWIQPNLITRRWKMKKRAPPLGKAGYPYHWRVLMDQWRGRAGNLNLVLERLLLRFLIYFTSYPPTFFNAIYSCHTLISNSYLVISKIH